MYSRGSTAPSSTHPVPVAVITPSTRREKAPVRWSSLTTNAARCRASDAESTPAYTRIGSTEGRRLNACSSAVVVAPPTKSRPMRPSDAHDTSEPGPPDRGRLDGAATPALVSRLMTLNESSAASSAPR